MNTPTLATLLNNFREDVIANLDSVSDKESAIAVLRAITLDALLLEQRINYEL